MRVRAPMRASPVAAGEPGWHQLPGRRFVPPALHEDLQDLALIVHRAPQVEMLAGDPHHHLVQMPPRGRLGPTQTKAPSDDGSELQHPPADRLVGHIQPPLGKQVLHVAVAQSKAQI